MDRLELVYKLTSIAEIPFSEGEMFLEMLLRKMSLEIASDQIVHLPELGSFMYHKDKSGTSKFVFTNLYDSDELSFYISEEKNITSHHRYSLSLGKPVLPLRGKTENLNFAFHPDDNIHSLESKAEKLLSVITETGSISQEMYDISKQTREDIEIPATDSIEDTLIDELSDSTIEEINTISFSETEEDKFNKDEDESFGNLIIGEADGNEDSLFLENPEEDKTLSSLINTEQVSEDSFLLETTEEDEVLSDLINAEQIETDDLLLNATDEDEIFSELLDAESGENDDNLEEDIIPEVSNSETDFPMGITVEDKISITTLPDINEPVVLDEDKIIEYNLRNPGTDFPAYIIEEDKIEIDEPAGLTGEEIPAAEEAAEFDIQEMRVDFQAESEDNTEVNIEAPVLPGDEKAVTGNPDDLTQPDKSELLSYEIENRKDIQEEPVPVNENSFEIKDDDFPLISSPVSGESLEPVDTPETSAETPEVSTETTFNELAEKVLEEIKEPEPEQTAEDSFKNIPEAVKISVEADTEVQPLTKTDTDITEQFQRVKSLTREFFNLSELEQKEKLVSWDFGESEQLEKDIKKVTRAFDEPESLSGDNGFTSVKSRKATYEWTPEMLSDLEDLSSSGEKEEVTEEIDFKTEDDIFKSDKPITKTVKVVKREQNKSKYFIIAFGILTLIAMAVITYFKFFDNTSYEQINRISNPVVYERKDLVPVMIPEKIEEVKPDIQTENNQPEVEAAENTEAAELEIVKISDSIFRKGDLYYVQVSSWQTKSKVNREAERFEAQGYKAEVQTSVLKSGLWYRLLIGEFNSPEEAENFLNK